MSFSDSMFLFELVVEDIQSFINYHDFSIVTQFADLFRLHLKNPNELNVTIPKRPRKKSKRKKVRDNKTKADKNTVESKIRVGQSVLIPNNIESLLLNMKKYPLLLSLCPKNDPEYALGSTNIPWDQTFIDYLNDLIKTRDVSPVTVEERYNVFDEISSRRMATIKMNIKLSCLKDKVTTQFRSLSEDNPQTFMYTGFNSQPTTILSTIKEKAQEEEVVNETGIIKTIYSGGKKFKRSSKDKNRTSKTVKPKNINSKTIQPKKEIVTNSNRSTEIDQNNELLETKDNMLVDLVKSDTDLVNKQVAVIKSKSYSTLEYESHLNTLNYIFGDHKGPYGNQVYCVGYFTVQNDNDNSSKETIKATKSSEKSLEPKEKYKFKICDSECPSKKATSATCSPSHCSLDLPADAAPLISVTKCNKVDCAGKKHREPPPRPDDRILIDLSSRTKSCCDINATVTEKVEQVIGGVTAKMQIGKDPCFCSCECRFGFTKKTTYCNVCGGYELVGDELSRRPGHDMPFPCPIFHKLIDKNKRKSVSASGSESKKRLDDNLRRKSTIGVESEKDGKKGKKKKKDDRFKFNYGYQGIRTYYNVFFFSKRIYVIKYNAS